MTKAAATERTAATMQRMEQAALQAGPDGLTTEELARGAGIGVAWAYSLARTHRGLIKARTRYNPHMRWFAASRADQAAAYVARMDSAPHCNTGPGAATRMAVVNHIVAAGAAGVTAADLQQLLGLSMCSVHRTTIWAQRDHGVQKRHVGVAVRYYGPDVQPPAHPDSRRQRAHRPAPLRLARAQQAGSPQPRVSAGPSKAMSAPASSVEDGLQGLTLKPGAKVTVARHHDPRAESAATALPLFAALRPGRYLDHDTAIARAYGGQAQPQTAGR